MTKDRSLQYQWERGRNDPSSLDFLEAITMDTLRLCRALDPLRLPPHAVILSPKLPPPLLPTRSEGRMLPF